DLRAPATIETLARLRAARLLDADDADVLEEAYRFCERARNARYLQSAQPSDALPGDRAELERLALLLGHVHQPHTPPRAHHPGPILYYLLWLPYRITGSTALSLCFAALTLNAIALAGIALVAKRRGGLPLVLVTLLLTSVLVSSLGAQFFRDVWNPSITILA